MNAARRIKELQRHPEDGSSHRSSMLRVRGFLESRARLAARWLLVSLWPTLPRPLLPTADSDSRNSSSAVNGRVGPHRRQVHSAMGDIILPRRMFLWCMAVIYLAAFVSLYVQIPGEPRASRHYLRDGLIMLTLTSLVSPLAWWRVCSGERNFIPGSLFGPECCTKHCHTCTYTTTTRRLQTLKPELCLL